MTPPVLNVLRYIRIHTHTVSLPVCDILIFHSIPLQLHHIKKRFKWRPSTLIIRPTYILRHLQFALHDQNCTDLPAEITVKSEKYILLAVDIEAALVSPKYHVMSQLTIPQPEKSYVYSTTFGVDQTSAVRSHMNPLQTLLSYLIYNHFNIILTYN